MSSEMVRKVKAAIGPCVEAGPCDGETIARMAIEAMLEPTEAMKDAGQQYGYGVFYEPQNEEAATIYRAMIRSALNDPLDKGANYGANQSSS